ncbi:protein of unknown function (plasmid) [Methylocella tundrae]|uniref:Uncharacterized protein n=1 Tax=Methylocella tundrae TaxID=227605 RepID=A0A4V6IND4_METTU|nr:protein of unknown function [Methylocella tundrae]
MGFPEIAEEADDSCRAAIAGGVLCAFSQYHGRDDLLSWLFAPGRTPIPVAAAADAFWSLNGPASAGMNRDRRLGARSAMAGSCIDREPVLDSGS